MNENVLRLFLFLYFLGYSLILKITNLFFLLNVWKIIPNSDVHNSSISQHWNSVNTALSELQFQFITNDPKIFLDFSNIFIIWNSSFNKKVCNLLWSFVCNLLWSFSKVLTNFLFHPPDARHQTMNIPFIVLDRCFVLILSFFVLYFLGYSLIVDLEN